MTELYRDFEWEQEATARKELIEALDAIEHLKKTWQLAYYAGGRIDDPPPWRQILTDLESMYKRALNTFKEVENG